MRTCRPKKLQRGVFACGYAQRTAVRVQQLNRTCRKTKLFTESLSHSSERLLEVLLTHEADDIVEDHRLALALLRLTCALALVGRELAGDDRGQQEQ